MKDFETGQEIDFAVDKNNLYREVSITDLKVASIRQLIPVKADGTDDTSRSPIYVGNTQLMTPEGALPLQARLTANNLSEAFADFPRAMQQALNEMIENIQKLQQQQKAQKRDESRIIVPGR